MNGSLDTLMKRFGAASVSELRVGRVLCVGLSTDPDKARAQVAGKAATPQYYVARGRWHGGLPAYESAITFEEYEVLLSHGARNADA